jgi:hypothetical protein
MRPVYCSELGILEEFNKAAVEVKQLCGSSVHYHLGLAQRSAHDLTRGEYSHNDKNIINKTQCKNPESCTTINCGSRYQVPVYFHPSQQVLKSYKRATNMKWRLRAVGRGIQPEAKLIEAIRDDQTRRGSRSRPNSLLMTSKASTSG